MSSSSISANSTTTSLSQCKNNFNTIANNKNNNIYNNNSNNNNNNNNINTVVNNNIFHPNRNLQQLANPQQQPSNYHPLNYQHNYQQQFASTTTPTTTTAADRIGSTNMPKNEPVKLVYPAGTQSTAVLNMNNNRVTFTTAPMQNGTITLSPLTNNQLSQSQQQQTAGMMQGNVGNIKITGTNLQGGQQNQQPTLIFKNATSTGQGTIITSSASGLMTMSKGINNQVNI